MTVDLDSTICQVHGKAKQGAAYGYTRELGYHPVMATRADTGEVLHARLRKGSSQRGARRFAEELIARLRRAGAAGELCVRADAGFFSYALIDTLTRLGVRWSVTVHITKQIRARINRIRPDAWQPITYPDGGQAEVADVIIAAPGSRRWETVRLVVRRTRLTDPAQAQLWPDWRYHAFITCATRRHQPGGMKGPTSGLSQQPGEAESSPTSEARSWAGAALTTTGRSGTARQAGSGKRDGKVYECRNQWWNPLKSVTGSNLVDRGRAAVHARLGGRLRPSDVMADEEATAKACGVTVAMLQGKSWAPTPSNG